VVLPSAEANAVFWGARCVSLSFIVSVVRVCVFVIHWVSFCVPRFCVAAFLGLSQCVVAVRA